MIADRPLYPVDPWRIRELTFDASFAARNETIFSLANGHLGMRGNLEEDAGNVVHGTYVNGFYEEAPIAYGEAAYGYARNHQVLLNVADGKRIQLRVGDEPLDLSTGTVEAYERSLDLRSGVLARTVRWRSPGGITVEVVARRLVSLARPAIAAIDLAVTLVDGEAPIQLVSADQRAGAQPGGVERPPRRCAPAGGLAAHRPPRGGRDVGRGRPADADHAPRDRGRDRPCRSRRRHRRPRVGGLGGRDVARDRRLAPGRRDRGRDQAARLRHVARPPGGGAGRLGPRRARGGARRAGSTPWRPSSARSSTASGAPPTSRSTATARSSRGPGSTCSACSSRRAATGGRASPRRACRARATRATTSGTPRSSRCRSSPTPSPRSRAPCCASGAGSSTRRAPAPPR